MQTLGESKIKRKIIILWRKLFSPSREAILNTAFWESGQLQVDSGLERGRGFDTFRPNSALGGLLVGETALRPPNRTGVGGH